MIGLCLTVAKEEVVAYALEIGYYFTSLVSLVAVTDQSGAVAGDEPSCFEKLGSSLEDCLERFFTSWGTGNLMILCVSCIYVNVTP